MGPVRVGENQKISNLSETLLNRDFVIFNRMMDVEDMLTIDFVTGAIP